MQLATHLQPTKLATPNPGLSKDFRSLEAVPPCARTCVADVAVRCRGARAWPMPAGCRLIADAGSWCVHLRGRCRLDAGSADTGSVPVIMTIVGGRVWLRAAGRYHGTGCEVPMPGPKITALYNIRFVPSV